MAIRWRWKGETTDDVNRFIHPQFLESKCSATHPPFLLSSELPSIPFLLPSLSLSDQQNCHVGFPSPSEKVNSFRRGGREGEAGRRGMKAGSGRSVVHSKKRNKTARKLHGSWLTRGPSARPSVYKRAEKEG